MYIKKTIIIALTGVTGFLFAVAHAPSVVPQKSEVPVASQTVKITNSKTANPPGKIQADAPASTGDPAVGQMFFTTITGAVQPAGNLLLAPQNDLYDIHIPFYNYSQTDSVSAGVARFTINLGRKLVLAPGFNLAAAPLSNYFAWSQADVAGNIIITGTQVAAIPPEFAAAAVFRVKGDSACRSAVVSTIYISTPPGTGDIAENNTTTLQYTLPVVLQLSRVNVTCNGAANGIIHIVASPGTTVVTNGPGGYTNTTSLPSGTSNFTLSGLQPGTYNITASAPGDAPFASCSDAATVVITGPASLVIPAAGISKTDINCHGAATGTVSVATSGGTSPYVYTIAGPTVNTTGVISGEFTGLTAGSYTVTVTDNNGCTAATAPIIITQPAGGLPDITLGADYTGNLFAAPGTSHTIVYNITEINGAAATGDTLRITKVSGFTITLNPALTGITIGGTNYALDNPRWKISNSHPSFTSIILTDPGNALNPGTLLCNEAVRVAVTFTRNSADIAAFTVSARLRRANGEVNMANNLNSIVFVAE
jgi:SprB repeat